MNSIITFNFLPTTVRADGLVNATALTAAYSFATISEVNPDGLRKDVAEWLVCDHAKRYIAHLERVARYGSAELVIVEHGVGTWVHPKLAAILAMWISPEFHIAVVELIEREMSSQKPQSKIASAFQLSNRQLAVEVSESIAKISSNLHNNMQLAQNLIDYAMKDIPDQQEVLTAEELPKDKKYGFCY
jgi:hypothetical protein